MADESQSGQDPRHPPSTYEAKYPMNRVTVTESGHELHFDDTPGKERIRMAHKSGSYMEISPNGKRTTMTVAHKIDYVKGGTTITNDKNYDRKTGGSERTSVSGDKHYEVKGTHSMAVGGDHKTTVGGDQATAIKGDLHHGVVGKMVSKVGGQANTKIDGDSHTIVDGETKMEHGKDVTFSSETKITFKVGGSTITMEPGKVTVKSDTIITDGTTLLGDPAADKLVGGKTSMDTAGDSLISKLAKNVYIMIN